MRLDVRQVRGGIAIPRANQVSVAHRSGPRPAETAVGANYYGANYWVGRLDRADVDRTMKTFAFLNQLIALQTESSVTGATPTVLAIGGR